MASTSDQQRAAIHWWLSSAPKKKGSEFSKASLCCLQSLTCAPWLLICRQFGTEICVCFVLGVSAFASAKDVGTTTSCVCTSGGWTSEAPEDCQGQRQNIFFCWIHRSKSGGVLREMIHSGLQTLCHPKCQPWKCHRWPPSAETKETKCDFVSLNRLLVAPCGVCSAGACWTLSQVSSFPCLVGKRCKIPWQPQATASQVRVLLRVLCSWGSQQELFPQDLWRRKGVHIPGLIINQSSMDLFPWGPQHGLGLSSM